MAEKSTVVVEEEEELLPFEVDADDKPVAGQTKAKKPATEDEEDDERVHLGAEDESERRKERQRRKDRQRKAQQRSREELETLRTQNHQLNERLANLERAAGNTTLAQLDDRISMARTQLAQANQALKAAMSKNNGDDFVKAQEVRDQARDVLNHLAGLKQRYQAQGGDQARERQQRQQVEQQEQPLPLDIQEHIDSFQEKHPWWNSKGRDKDSKVVLRLDNEIAEEGYDPAEPEYWEELERRVREELPHRFSGENGAREQRSPRVGAGSTEAGTRKLNKNYVKITPERKQAMIDAGAWDDPDKRKRMLKRYRDYDVAHATDRRA